MSDMKSELEKRDVLRMSNEQSNKLTKECLQTALIYLMNEKPFDKITVTELVKRSGVSRTAFYRNYSSKEDILNEISNDIIGMMADSIRNEQFMLDPYKWFLGLFDEIRKSSGIVSLLLKANMLGEIFSGVTEKLKSGGGVLSPEKKYVIDALIGAHSAVMVSWFDSGMAESNEEMAALCVRLKNIFDSI